MADQDTLKGFRAAALRVGVTGAVRVAPLGTELPKFGEKYDTNTFHNVGYLSPDGVAVSFDEDANEYVPWQEAVAIRRDITKSVTSVQITLWDFGKRNAEMFFGSEAVTEADGTWHVDVSGKPEFERQMVVIDVVDGDKAMKLILPVAQITAREGVTFKSDEAVALGITFTAYPASAEEYPNTPELEGKSARWYFSDTWDGTGATSTTTSGEVTEDTTRGNTRPVEDTDQAA